MRDAALRQSNPDDVPAYTEKKYRSPLLGDGYVVLRLAACVRWMNGKEFKGLLAQQRGNSPEEIQMLQE
jgi:hypothetical protein